jgi:two-component system invasion response regulator UvrY
MRVLLADDHEIVRRGLRAILADAFDDVECVEAGTCQEAVASATGGLFDLIVLDINMPGRGGLDVLSELRQRRTATPVIVVSAFPESEYAVRAFQLGASGFVAKQSASDELVTAVRTVLRGGLHVSPALAQSLALAVGRRSDGAAHEHLSPRELEVMRLIAAGRSTKDIAADLSLSEKTVGTYRSRLMAKLKLRNSVEIARHAIHHRLVD